MSKLDENHIAMSNKFLPSEIRTQLQLNDETSLIELKEFIVKLEEEFIKITDNNLIDFEIVQHVITRIIKRKTLKYKIDIDTLTNACTILYKIYIEKKLSIINKSKILSCMNSICSRKDFIIDTFIGSGNDNNKNKILFQWKYFWDEIIGIISRQFKSKSNASEKLIISHLTCLVEFIHGARKYINNSEADKIIETSFELLKDLRQKKCVEGVLLLINCLPTNYSGYDTMLPRWMEIWATIDHNSAWDACWLTLFTRSRKHTKTFDWSLLHSQFFIKARDLMKLPTGKGKSPQESEYPHNLPNYYSILISLSSENSNGDPRKIALCKISKIIYFISLQQSESITKLIQVEPISITPSKQLASAANPPIIIGYNIGAEIQNGTNDIVMFYQSLRSYFYPSNTGPFTQYFAYFMTTMITELSRHISRNLAHCIVGKSLPLKPFILFENPVHMTSLKFLLSTFTLITMEGLYSKNNVMMQFCSKCLQNICAIDPNIGHVIIPFLLAALDPSAVNQPHQAPAAMHTLNLCFKPLLYPSPVIIEYLPTLFRLSLAGIDPNDISKTSLTMRLYSTILSFIPILSIDACTRVYKYPPSYLSTISSHGDKHLDNIINNDILTSHLDNLYLAINKWGPELFDKIFILIDATEPKRKGANTSTIGSSISECCGYLFQSLAVTHPLRDSLITIFLSYINSNNPFNGAKICGKIIESIVGTHPTCIIDLLPKILNVELDCSAEKLAVRIRMACGAVRGARGDNIFNCIGILQPFLAPSMLHNTDKHVRKASCKLMKDILKGCTCYYPIDIIPLYDADNSLIGSPNDINAFHSKWHQPTSKGINIATDIINNITIKAMNDIKSDLASITTNDPVEIADSTDSTSISIKKSEERIFNGLVIIRKSLRGCAEILGDDMLDINMNTDTVGDVHPNAVLYTGRGSEYLSKIGSTAEEISLFTTLRYTILTFLIDVCQTLDDLVDTQFRSIGDNEIIRKQWIKILVVLITQRMACLKNVDKVKHWFNMTKRLQTCTIVKSMTRILEIHERNGDLSNNLLISSEISQVAYWKGHDINTNNIANHGWLQHAKRLSEFSFLSMNFCRKHSSISIPYLKVLDQLGRMCGHEYDVIRSNATKVFQNISSRYKNSVIDIVIKPMLSSLTTVGISYSKASGGLTMVSQPFIMKKIANNWELTNLYLEVVSKFPVVISNIVEKDKQEHLVNHIASSFTKYIEIWNHIPISSDQANISYNNALSNVGFLSEFNVTSISSSSYGLRHDTFCSFMLLHLIGHNDIKITSGIWAWSLHNLLNSHGPTQMLASIAFLKLAYIANREGMDPVISHHIKSFLSINIEGNTSVVKQFLSGISSCHQKNENPQWSKGIDHILHNGLYIKSLLPRSVSDGVRICSHNFTFENAAIFMCLPTILNASSDEELIIIVNNLLVASKLLEFTNEEEDRANNTTRSELFSGLYRTIINNSATKTSTTIIIETILVDYFSEYIEKVSKDFCTDWSESIIFATSCNNNTMSDKLVVFVLDNFRKALTKCQELGSSNSTDDEGFSKYDKFLQITKTLLRGDIISCSKNNIQTSIVGLEILVIMKDYDCISPYRSTRAEISSIVGQLCDIHIDIPTEDLLIIIDKIVNISINPTISSTNLMNDGDIDSLKIAMVKYSSETSLFCLQHLLYGTITWRKELFLPQLLSSALSGSSHPDLEIAKSCHETCLMTVQSITSGIRTDISSNCITTSSSGAAIRAKYDIIYNILTVLQSNINNASWHVREITLLCISIIMIKNWFVLTADEKKSCRDLFSIGLTDSKPEIVEISKTGMVAYLSLKPTKELNAAASAYIKNSDILATREKKRKKDSGSNGDKPDKVYISTVQMVACLVSAFPFDLPYFMPDLVTSLSKHSSSSAVQDTVKRCIQDFKSTHQDRWNDFKESFTHDQLDDLQGAGAAHYYA